MNSSGKRVRFSKPGSSSGSVPVAAKRRPRFFTPRTQQEAREAIASLTGRCACGSRRGVLLVYVCQSDDGRYVYDQKCAECRQLPLLRGDDPTTA